MIRRIASRPILAIIVAAIWTAAVLVFTRAIVSGRNTHKLNKGLGLDVHGVDSLRQAIEAGIGG